MPGPAAAPIRVVVAGETGKTGSAVAIQTDGKIVVVGNTTVFQDFAIVRYNPDGTLDPAFSGARPHG